MNLRDLIYSSQSDYSQDETRGSSTPKWYESQTDDSSKQVDGTAHDALDRYHEMCLAGMPSKRMRFMPKLYRASPEIKYRITHPYAPGEDSFLRFPQHTTSLQINNRECLRQLWHQSVFSNDLTSAIKVLHVLVTIDSVEWSDFTYLVNMLTAHNIPDFKLLSTIAIPMKLQRGRKDVARELMQLFIEIFVAQNDVDFAQNILQTHMSHTSIANDLTLLSYHSLFLVSQCTSFSLSHRRGYKEHGVLLSVDVLASRPIFFAYVIELLCQLQEQPNSVGTQARRFLTDLKNSFARSVEPNNDNTIVHLLYISYLQGLDKSEEAKSYLKDLSGRLGDVEVMLQYRLSYSLCFEEFSLDDVADIVLQLANIPRNAEYVIIALLLYNGNKLSSLELLSVLLRAIEAQQYVDTAMEWLLWKSLVCILGALSYVSRASPLIDESDIIASRPEVCWKRGASMEEARSEEILQLRIQTQKWWKTTILCPATLGDFTWGVLEDDISAISKEDVKANRLALLMDKSPPISDLVSDAQSDVSSTSSSSASSSSNVETFDVAQFKTVLRAIVFKCVPWQDILNCDINFGTIEKRRFRFPHEFMTKAMDYVHDEDRHIYTHLSEGSLEIIAMKIVVAAHIYSPDCIFACRGTQLLLQHKSSTLVNYLVMRNFNVERACYLASSCYKANISVVGPVFIEDSDT